jgi:MoaA/NifB/PqqE/SkfB family radical SAM enzyme
MYYTNPESEKEELKLSEIENFFEKSDFLRWVSFTGGEPFLRRDLYKIVKSAYEECKNLTIANIPTNGFYTRRIVKTTEKILNKTSIPFFLVSVSCDGRKEVHNLIKNKKNSWENSIQTFKSLVELQKSYPNLHVILEYTLSKLNERFFPEDIRELRTLGIETAKIHINFFHTSNHFYHNASTKLFLNPSTTKKISLLRRMRRNIDPLTIFSNIYLKIVEKKFVNRNRLFKRCFAGKSSVFLDPYGNLYPCIIFDRRIGNIRNFDYDLKKILKSKNSTAVRKLVQLGKCPGCFTPCETYQNMMLNPLEVIKYSFL